MSIAKVLATGWSQLLRQPATARGFLTSAIPPPITLPPDVPIEEEGIPGYHPTRFLAVNPGDLLDNRYKILVKIGWGTSSTVWLAQDTQRYVLDCLGPNPYFFSDGGGTKTVT